MNGALTIGGVHLAVQVSRGPLEALLCMRYATHLGRIEQPCRWLSIGPSGGRDDVVPGAEVDGGTVRLRHSQFTAALRDGDRSEALVMPSAAALDLLLTSVFALDGPSQGTIMLGASAVATTTGCHLLIGHRRSVEALLREATFGGVPVVGDFTVAAARTRGYWEIHSVPFAEEGVERRSALRAIWVVEADGRSVDPLAGAEAAGYLLERSIRPAPSVRAFEAFDLATRMAEAVPAGTLPVQVVLSATNPWERLDELASALDVRRALTTSAPEMRTRLLHSSLDPVAAPPRSRSKPRST